MHRLLATSSWNFRAWRLGRSTTCRYIAGAGVFELTVLGKNGVSIDGVLFTPNSSPAPLASKVQQLPALLALPTIPATVLRCYARMLFSCSTLC
jgi:hypothetical protein